MHKSSTRTGQPPLAELDTIRVVARHGSLTGAASELGLTHGTVSRRLAGVETWLGQTLFERHARGVRPTPEGQRFLARITEAFTLIEGAAERWVSRRGPEVVRISVLPSIAKLWLLQRLAALESGDGSDGLRLRIEIAVEHRTADLERGEADVAIRCGRGRWPNLEAQPLMPETLFPMAHPDVARRLGPDPTPDCLLEQPLLHDSDATGWRAWFAGMGLTLKPRPQDRRFEDYLLVLAAAEAGLGLALARSPLIDQELAGGSLVRVSRREVDSPLRYYIVTRPGEKRPAVRALISRMLVLSRNERMVV